MIKNRLKEIRMKEYMMNVSEFSKMLNINISTYSQWESGVNSPTLEKAYDVAEKLNRPITEIWFK